MRNRGRRPLPTRRSFANPGAVYEAAYRNAQRLAPMDKRWPYLLGHLYALTGRQAVQYGIAWQALPDAEVEPRAMTLASRAATNPAVARRAAQSMRQELGPPAVPWEVAAEAERGLQLWSAYRAMSARDRDG